MLLAFYPPSLPGKIWQPLYRRLLGPQGQFGWVRKTPPPPPGFDPHSIQQWKCHSLRYKECFILQEFLIINIHFFYSDLSQRISFFGEKNMFTYVTQKTYYNIMTFMVCLFQNLFSPLCNFVSFTVVLTELKREKYCNLFSF
jgi:hypothetical protein